MYVIFVLYVKCHYTYEFYFKKQSRRSGSTVSKERRTQSQSTI